MSVKKKIEKVPTRAPRPLRDRRRAVAMIGVMLCLLFVTSILLLGVMTNRTGNVGSDATQALQMAQRRGYQNVAQNLAEGGMRLAAQWLLNQSSPPTGTSAWPPSSFYGGTVGTKYTSITQDQNGVNGTMNVRFYPFSTNGTVNRKMFIVESVGTYMGYSVILRGVLKQNSFARYAYFSDLAPTGWWVAGSTRFQGPVHVNGSNSTGTGVDSTATLQILWRNSGSGTPASNDQIFTYTGPDYLTTSIASSKITWVRNQGGTNTTATPTSSTWIRVTAANAAPKTSVARIIMPTSSTTQESAALGTMTAPTTSGVYVPASGGASNGGIYVKGDVDSVVLSTSGSTNTNQIFTVKQTVSTVQYRYTITVNRDGAGSTQLLKEHLSGTTWVSDSTNTYTGATNGVFYVNGNIGTATSGGIHGSVANNKVDGSGNITAYNNFNIVTEATKTAFIDGSVSYQNQITDTSNPNNPYSSNASASSASGTLGIVANTLRIAAKDAGGSDLTSLSVHATLMAYTSFLVDNYDTRPVGTFILIGGFIVKSSGNFGTVASDGTALTGFVVNRNYDQRVADNPPPYFPTTGNNYTLTSLERVTSTLD